jgi:putative polyhydroxyalkanoate system protein
MLAAMPSLDITQPHTVTAEEARRRLEQFNQELQERYGLVPTWTSATQAKIERAGARGTLTIEPAQIRVHIDLPLTFSPLKGKVEARIRRELVQLFE